MSEATKSEEEPGKIGIQWTPVVESGAGEKPGGVGEWSGPAPEGKP